MSTDKKRILNIINSDPFSPRIINKVQDDDLFYEIYEKAITILEEILVFEADKKEDINNIIAFCGERGSGKTSTMTSFSQMLCNEDLKNLLLKHFIINTSEINQTRFCKPILIDPSYFDGIHSVVDITVANMYQTANEEYHSRRKAINSSSGDIDTLNNEYKELISKFSDTYEKLSLMVDTNRILETEYDYSGDLAKVARLGKSLGLKDSFHVLTEKYLNFIESDLKKKKLIIEIDDVDLCSNNVFNIVEQVRKYLMQDNVIVLLGMKTEQFDMCLQEKYLNDYKNLLRYSIDNSAILNEVKSMARAYSMKLIPDVHRLDLSNVHIGSQTLVKTDNTNNSVQTLQDYIISTIVNKTGLALNKDEEAFLIPSNLRSVINIIEYFKSLYEEGPKNSDNYAKNANLILSYIKNAVITEETYRSHMVDYMKVIDADYRYMDMIVADSFSKNEYPLQDNRVSYSLTNVFRRPGEAKDVQVKMLDNINLWRFIYSLKLHIATIDNPKAVDHCIDYNFWEDIRKIVLAGSSYRKNVDTISAVDSIVQNTMDSVDSFNINEWLTVDKASSGKVNRGPDSCLKIESKNEFLEKLIILLMMTRVEKGNPLVSPVNPSFLSRNLQVQWVNYIINMTHIDYFIDNSGVRYILGNDTQEIDSILENFKTKNKDLIIYLKWLRSNPIICDKIISLAERHRDYREKKERVLKSVELFSQYLLLTKVLKGTDSYTTDFKDMCIPEIIKDNAALISLLDTPMLIFSTVIDKAQGLLVTTKMSRMSKSFNKDNSNYAELATRLTIVKNNLLNYEFSSMNIVDEHLKSSLEKFIKQINIKADETPTAEFTSEEKTAYLYHRDSVELLYKNKK